MPHVLVHFDASKVKQSVIDKLKPELGQIVAKAMSYRAVDQPDTLVLSREIYVRQAPSHPTDFNPAVIEIEVQAGRRKERDPEHVTALIRKGVCDADLIPEDLLATDECCIWLRFSGENSFRKF